MRTATIVLTLILLMGCTTDKHRIDGNLAKIKGKYYRIENRAGNVYAFEEIITSDTVNIISK